MFAWVTPLNFEVIPLSLGQSLMSCSSIGNHHQQQTVTLCHLFVDMMQQAASLGPRLCLLFWSWYRSLKVHVILDDMLKTVLNVEDHLVNIWMFGMFDLNYLLYPALSRGDHRKCTDHEWVTGGGSDSFVTWV